MEFNWIILLGTALIPLITGFVWYHPKIFGNAWMRTTGLTEAQLKGSNMAIIFGLTYVLGLMLSAAMITTVIHQMHLMSLFVDEPGFDDPQSDVGRQFASLLENYGRNFRTFGHGALHGAIAALFFALPVLGINALFERRGGKYVAIHSGYWVLTLALIGGVICAWL